MDRLINEQIGEKMRMSKAASELFARKTNQSCMGAPHGGMAGGSKWGRVNGITDTFSFHFHRRSEVVMIAGEI